MFLPKPSPFPNLNQCSFLSSTADVSFFLLKGSFYTPPPTAKSLLIVGLLIADVFLYRGVFTLQCKPPREYFDIDTKYSCTELN